MAYLSILRPSRRDTIKQALSNLISETEKYESGMMPEARERAAVMVLEAKQMLREIAATESMLLGQPITQDKPSAGYHPGE